MWKLVVVTVFLSSQALAEDHYVKLRRNPDSAQCLILAQETIQRYKGYKDRSQNSLAISTKPAITFPADSKILTLPSSNNDEIIEMYGRNQGIVQVHMESLCKSISTVEPLLVRSPISGRPSVVKEPEIVKIIDGGDQANRIDVVFMGDGYTGEEREEFFDDMRRLTRDMFQTTTFRSYLPVFNIWAIYVESVDSGIGYDGALDTPFQLYREAGQLRGIYPGNPAYARQVCLLTGPSGCDYPSIIGNDDYYGGLGGEFVISTRSNRTGTVVLRHEMGHNFVDVGEEYDNGYVYSGVNAARSVETLGWSHWLTGERREERAIYRVNAYPWQDLGEVEYYEVEFVSDGDYHRWYTIVSVSAAGEEASLEFRLDGEILPWTTSGFDDREFYSWHGDQGFSPGRHVFSVRALTPSTNDKVPRMICSINIHEYGNEEEFHADNNHVSAYPTWSAFGIKSFRPGNEKCLMRNMSSTSFCSVCQEGMWHQFFQRISLIDDLILEEQETPDLLKLTVKTLKLGQLRDPELPVAGEKLEVHWYLNGQEVTGLRDQFEVSVVTGSGDWTVKVNFVTDEVRSDPTGLLSDSKSVSV